MTFNLLKASDARAVSERAAGDDIRKPVRRPGARRQSALADWPGMSARHFRACGHDLRK